VRAPVTVNEGLASAIEAAFRLDPEPLAIDGLVFGLTEALLDDSILESNLRRVAVERERLAGALRDIGWSVRPSVTTFNPADLGTATPARPPADGGQARHAGARTASILIERRNGTVRAVAAFVPVAEGLYGRESSGIHWVRRVTGAELMGKLLQRDASRKGSAVLRLDVRSRGGGGVGPVKARGLVVVAGEDHRIPLLDQGIHEPERGSERARQHRHSVFRALAIAHSNLVIHKVQVLDA